MKHTEEQMEYALEVAKECFQQIRTLTPLHIYFSWGVSKVNYTIWRDMPALVLQVNGFLHKGKLLVCYDGSSDAYNIYCLNNQREVVKQREEVYFDELPDAIDHLIERDYCTSDDEYKQQVKQSLI